MISVVSLNTFGAVIIFQAAASLRWPATRPFAYNESSHLDTKAAWRCTGLWRNSSEWSSGDDADATVFQTVRPSSTTWRCCRDKTDKRHMLTYFHLFFRLFKFPQMDFEMAVWEMTSLLIAPKKVFRSIYYHVIAPPSHLPHCGTDSPRFTA